MIEIDHGGIPQQIKVIFYHEICVTMLLSISNEGDGS